MTLSTSQMKVARELNARLAAIEATVFEIRDFLINQQPTKESYSTVDVARILGKKPYTVREWCRLQRVNATKAMCGRGSEVEWRISHQELERVQNEGLLPLPERF